MAQPDPARGRITRDDLEEKLRELEGGAREQVASTRSTLVTAGVVGLLILLVIAFVLGTRKGRQRSTIVEIRRV
ncbi:MAG TPA: hypothetical protein VFZ77_21470 [Acidimicrobiales bacterium]